MRWGSGVRPARPIFRLIRRDSFPTGPSFRGPQGLRTLLLERHDQFVGTVTEKLLSYALGRGPQYFDRPTVRTITREAAQTDYRWSSIIMLVL